MSSTLMNLSADEINTLRTNWGWSLAAGILVTIIGAAAMIHSVAATFVSLAALAWLMIFAGIALAVHGIRTHKWSGFLLDLFGRCDDYHGCDCTAPKSGGRCSCSHNDAGGVLHCFGNL